MSRHLTLRVPHPAIFISAPKFASRAVVEPPPHDLRLWADPSDDVQWLIEARAEQLEDEELEDEEED